MVRAAIVVLVSLSLAGCNPAGAGGSQAVDACETYIKSKLRSPATYARINTTISTPKPGQPFRSVYVEYDASNAFGAPVRNVDHCIFEVDPEMGAFPSRAGMDFAITRAQTDALDRIAQHDEPSPADNLLVCCAREDIRAKALAEMYPSILSGAR